MLFKTRPTRDGAAYQPVSEVTRETIRQLAEITERYAGVSIEQSPTAIPAQAGATPAIAPTAPTVAAPKPGHKPRHEARDIATMEAMSRVRDRAMAHQAAESIAARAYGPPLAIEPDYVAEHKCRPLKLSHVGAAQSDGTCPYQQDVAVADWKHGSKQFKVAAVCDGHGQEAPGDVMPWHVLQRNLIATLRAHLPAPGADTPSPYRVHRALTRAICNSREKPRSPLSMVEQMAQCNAMDNGSTLVAAVQVRDSIYVLNVGDSRAVLVRRDGTAHQMTVDHKTNDPEEQKLIAARVAAGQASVEANYPHRMLRYGRDGNCYAISMSRSIGDDRATMSTPEISMFKVTPGDLALVLCSDGVFDTIQNEQVGLYVSAVMSQAKKDATTLAQRAAEGLVSWCYDTEMYVNKGDVRIDNMTALVLPLQTEF